MNYTVCNRKLLFVEDDEKLKREMIAYFSPENRIFTASDVEEAVNLLETVGNFDAVVLDLILKNSMGTDLFKDFPESSAEFNEIVSCPEVRIFFTDVRESPVQEIFRKPVIVRRHDSASVQVGLHTFFQRGFFKSHQRSYAFQNFPALFSVYEQKGHSPVVRIDIGSSLCPSHWRFPYPDMRPMLQIP